MAQPRWVEKRFHQKYGDRASTCAGIAAITWGRNQRKTNSAFPSSCEYGWSFCGPQVLQPRRSVEDKAATTILVFCDGRRSEIQNFAIVGQALWVFHRAASTEDTRLRSRSGSHKGSECRSWCRFSAPIAEVPIDVLRRAHRTPRYLILTLLRRFDPALFGRDRKGYHRKITSFVSASNRTGGWFSILRSLCP